MLFMLDDAETDGLHRNGADERPQPTMGSAHALPGQAAAPEDSTCMQYACMRIRTACFHSRKPAQASLSRTLVNLVNTPGQKAVLRCNKPALAPVCRECNCCSQRMRAQ